MAGDYAYTPEIWLPLAFCALFATLILLGNALKAAAAERGERYGLQSMRERAEAANGSLAVLSRPGQGTQIVAHVPMKERI